MKKENPPLTKEELEERIKKYIFKEGEESNQSEGPFGVKKEGEWYKINTGKLTLWTREGGYQLFLDAMKKAGENLK